MCDFCRVLFAGFTNSTSRHYTKKHRHHYLNLALLPERLSGKLKVSEIWMQPHKQCWSIWKIFKQIWKQLSFQPFHRNFLICFSQSLSSDESDLWGYCPAVCPVLGRCDLCSEISRAEHRLILKIYKLRLSAAATKEGLVRAGFYAKADEAQSFCCHKRYQGSDNILNSHIKTHRVSPVKPYFAKNVPEKHIKAHTPKGWVVSHQWQCSYYRIACEIWHIELAL